MIVDPSAPILLDLSDLFYSDIEILNNNNVYYFNRNYPLGLIFVLKLVRISLFINAI